MNDNLNINDKPELLVSIIGLIDHTSQFVAQTVNQELILPDWKIGKTSMMASIKRTNSVSLNQDIQIVPLSGVI
jgi:hypothetical protein